MRLAVETLPRARRGFADRRPPRRGVERTELLARDVRIHVNRPLGARRPVPCILSIHGGGFVLGTPTMDEAILEEWCAELGVLTVSVDYRLAPETPYPGPLEDCYEVLRWIHDDPVGLGVDPERIGVRGQSAGGGLAAALALLVRERAGPRLEFQLLDSPMLDDRVVTPSSRRAGLPVWTTESNEFGWRSYLGALHGSDDVPATAAPARARDLRGLPAAFVSVGAADGFHDEVVEYAVRLNHAGVPCELHVYAGACHGYHLVEGARIAAQSARDQLEWLAHRLDRG